jgi:2-polyprenyl-3-methyl-5-hydroxy-6-metoxy-1,4-benzoquinol methylase/glycosyltransferase involved in cell wall biosynthesis
MTDSRPSVLPALQVAQVPPCPLCFQQTAVPLCSAGGFDVWRCPACCFDFVFPPPPPQTLDAYYNRGEWFEAGEPGGYRDYDEQSASSHELVRRVLESFPAAGPARSVLDIGCAYGNHLSLAVEKGWKCFGVEPSEHARAIARQRLARNAFVVETIADLIPHSYDLILMLDVLEHVADPLSVFYDLFGQGAITPDTRVVVSTPNARSTAAIANPSGWEFRHPPSHLCYFSAEALVRLFTRLRFRDIAVEGLHEAAADGPGTYADETSDLNRRHARHHGLACTATGSDFTEFMRERYVPGTWSEISRYEHIPRYQLAMAHAAGKRVLDFGCGTGYGTALLARQAQQAVGVDIDAEAIAWARATHAAPCLRYEQRSDLGAGVPDSSFDIVTCFEMIEHVDAPTQRLVVEQFSRILGDGGCLIISTPNPAVTGGYGENPFHKHEMDQEEFLALLRTHFAHVRLYRQHVLQTVAFSESDESPGNPATAWETMIPGGATADAPTVPPLAFVAVCSRTPSAGLAAGRVAYADLLTDPVRSHLDLQRKRWRSQMDYYTAREECVELESKAAELENEAAELENKVAELEGRIAAYASSLPVRLGNALYRVRVVRALARAVRYTHAQLGPGKLRSLFRRGCRGRDALPHALSHQVIMPQAAAGAPVVVHALANMMTGGSSRLVVDLLERLGGDYAHKVLTSFVPDPPAYLGLDVTEMRGVPRIRGLDEYFTRCRPALLHLHYWGECDRPWYQSVLTAAERHRVPVLENVNTPVAPLVSPVVRRYVYVSEYVRRTFGRGARDGIVIYPGSDFSLFSGTPEEAAFRDAVGMVYRLEDDKLGPRAIDPFIAIARLRSATQVYIVGGGSYLNPYRTAVANAGLEGRFHFTGPVAYRSLPQWYQRFGVFVAPVFKESFGQVSPFAMSMGIPVVGYDTGAVAEIIGNPALVAPVGDHEALAAIACRLMADPERRVAEGRRQQERAHRHFALESMIASYRQLYLELVPGSSPCG